MGSLGVIWRSGGLLMATDSRSVVEVLPPVRSRPAPGTPDWVRGLFVYRGGLIPLVDTVRLLAAEPAPDRMANRVIVVRVGRGGTAGDWPVGLWVEAVIEIERIEFSAAGGHPGLSTAACRFLGPVAQTRWGLVQEVTPEVIFTPEQVRVLTERIGEAAA